MGRLKDINDIIDIISVRNAKDIYKVLKKVSDSAADSIEKINQVIQEIYTEHEKDLSNVLTRIYERSTRTISKYEKINFEYSGKSRSLKFYDSEFEKLMREWIKNNLGKKITGISNTTREQITVIVNDGQEIGLTADEIARRIRENVGNQFSRSRALMIALTETHSASMYASQTTNRLIADELGVKLKKEWISTNDDATRESHLQANGDLVEMDSKFIVGGQELEYPGDPNGSAEEIINCRCVMGYKRM